MSDIQDKRFAYIPRLSGIENINRVLQKVGIPEELLDDVEIESVKDASLSEFKLYEGKVGNTALKVNYLGELARLTKKSSEVFFYDRVPPIPDAWKNRTMFVRDSELKNFGIDQYVKNRWLQDGYPFVGENLSFEVRGTSGLLNYGRNTIEIRPSVRSYGLVGVGLQRVQYFVDLNDKQAKYVAVVNPFLSQVTLSKKDGWIELATPNEATVKETERKILDRFLKEAYGINRGKVVLDEIDAESILLVRSPDFKEQLRNPTTPEQELEKKAAKDYVTSYLYTLSENQEEDEASSVYGNIRLMIGKGNLAKLVKDSNRFHLEEEQAYRFKTERVRSFVLSNSEENHVQFEITLGKYENSTAAFEAASKIIKVFFDSTASFVTVERESIEDGVLNLLISPSSEISDYVAGDIKAIVNFTVGTNTPVTDPTEDTSGKVTILGRNLPGFSGVSLSD